MPKTTARVKERLYVPHGWIAIEYCNLDFFGVKSSEYNRLWDEVRYSRYRETEETAKKLEDELKDLHKLLKEGVDTRSWLQKVFSPNPLIKKITEKEQQISKFNSARFFRASELSVKAESFLKEHGFVLMEESRTGGDGPGVTTKVFTKD